MNKYIRGFFCGTIGIIKNSIIKTQNGKMYHCKLMSFYSPYSEITIEKGANVTIGNRFRMRGGSRIRVRKNAILNIGDNINLNHGCMIVCRENIIIGSGTQFGPNVLIYDHDHDYMAPNGINDGLFNSGKVIIGENVWIGADCVILRNTCIGNNCVIAAGSIIKGNYPDNCVIYQKKDTRTKHYEFRDYERTDNAKEK